MQVRVPTIFIIITAAFFASALWFGYISRANLTKKLEPILPFRKSSTNDRDEGLASKQNILRQYNITPLPCPDDSNMLVVIICFSRPNGFKLRSTIRNTWGKLASPVCGVRLLFMLGITHDISVQSSINKEAILNGDIIQSNQFEDHYRSAATKALHLLQWGATFCSRALFIAKIDDDNWLNLPKFFRFLEDVHETDYVLGAIFNKGSKVQRGLEDKYYVPKEEYDPDYYPAYLSGILYTFPTRHIAFMLEVSKTISLTFNDDVYVCGILADAANLTRLEVPDYAWSNDIIDSNCPKCKMMCIHYSQPIDFYRLWRDPCCHYEELC